MLILHAVVQLDETIFEALDGAQLQARDGDAALSVL
jgi:hypothetical protein